MASYAFRRSADDAMFQITSEPPSDEKTVGTTVERAESEKAATLLSLTYLV